MAVVQRAGSEVREGCENGILRVFASRLGPGAGVLRATDGNYSSNH